MKLSYAFRKRMKRIFGVEVNETNVAMVAYLLYHEEIDTIKEHRRYMSDSILLETLLCEDEQGTEWMATFGMGEINRQIYFEVWFLLSISMIKIIIFCRKKHE